MNTINDMNEIWKDVPCYEGVYKVSNLGNVKSLKYNKERILKQGCNKGYMNVKFFIKNTSKSKQVHQLVAMAFLGHKPCGHKIVVNHKNLNKSDNRLENLELVTHRENTNMKHIKSSSKYTGVCWNKNYNKWASNINVNGKNIFLGNFKNEYDAHLAYQEKLKQIENEFKR